MTAVSISLFRFPGLAGRLWAVSQMALARRPLSRLPGIGFFKLCGTGTGEGFTPRPNTAVWAILATWPDEAHARRMIADAPVYRRFRARAGEHCSFLLGPLSARGRWSGRAPFEPPARKPAADGPLAVLTRATIRPRAALGFWGRVPDIEAAIGADPNVAFKIGRGEVPWVRQVTFSVRPDRDSMVAFAHRDGPHARAVRAVREGDWFSEELYARFAVLGTLGQWEGRAPLSALAEPAGAAAGRDERAEEAHPA